MSRRTKRSARSLGATSPELLPLAGLPRPGAQAQLRLRTRIWDRGDTPPTSFPFADAALGDIAANAAIDGLGFHNHDGTHARASETAAGILALLAALVIATGLRNRRPAEGLRREGDLEEQPWETLGPARYGSRSAA
jgi:hypothetical protein